jgi:hypothetical protein
MRPEVALTPADWVRPFSGSAVGGVGGGCPSPGVSMALPCEPHELPAVCGAVEVEGGSGLGNIGAVGTARRFNIDQHRPSCSEGTVKPDGGGEQFVGAGEVQGGRGCPIQVQEGSMTAISQCMHHVGRTFFVRTTESLSSAALFQEGQNESPASYQEVDQRPAGDGNELNEVANRTANRTAANALKKTNAKVQKVNISQKRLQTVVNVALVNARTSLPVARPGDSSSSCLLGMGIKRKALVTMAPPAEKLKRGAMLSTPSSVPVQHQANPQAQHLATASSLSNVRGQNGNFMGDAAAAAIVDDAISAVLENGIAADAEGACDAISKASDSE